MRILPMNVLNVIIALTPIPQPHVLAVIPAITIMQVPTTFNRGSRLIVQVAIVNRVGRVLHLITTINISQFILEIIEESGTAVRIVILPLEIIVYSVVLIVMNTIMRLNWPMIIEE